MAPYKWPAAAALDVVPAAFIQPAALVRPGFVAGDLHQLFVRKDLGFHGMVSMPRVAAGWWSGRDFLEHRISNLHGGLGIVDVGGREASGVVDDALTGIQFLAH